MANFKLADAIKDKRTYPDSMQITVGDGLTMTLGEMREYQEAAGVDVAKQLEAERSKLAEEQHKLLAGQEELVNLWTRYQAAVEKQQQQAPQVPTPNASDWTKDPFFAPVAEYLKANIESKVAQQAEQISQFQKALGLGVKYITDVISEQRYAMLPEDFRKEVGYDIAVKTAADKRFLDSGGVPDVRRVHEEWSVPRQRKAETDRIQKEAYDKARADLMSSQLSRPSGMPVAPSQEGDPNRPKTIRESFQRLKEDPEFLNQIYNLTGQA
jgi:hypothetical protein